MRLLQIAKVLSIVALALQIGSIFLPYSINTRTYIRTLGGIEKHYESGIEQVAPLFAIIAFLIIMVLHLVRHSLVTKIFALILSILVIFPGGLILWFVATFSFMESKKITIGFFLFAFAALLLFFAAILKMTVRVQKNRDQNSELLDSF